MNGRKRRVAALGAAAVALVGLTVPASTVTSALAASAPAQCPTTDPQSIATIQLAGNGLGGMVVNPVTDRIYVSNMAAADTSSVVVIDGLTNRKIANILNPPGPLSVDDRADRIYSGNSGNLTVIDGRNNRVARTIHIGGGQIYPDVDSINGLVYAASFNTNSVVVLSTRTEKVIARIPVGPGPSALTIDPRTHRVYVANTNNGPDNTVSVINELTNKVITTIPMHQFIRAIAVNTWTNLVYVGDGAVWSVIDGRTNSVTTTFETGEPGFLAVDPNIDTIFNGNGDDVMFGLCGHTNTVTTAVGLASDGAELGGIAVDTRTQRVYAVDNFYGRISVFDYSGTAG